MNQFALYYQVQDSSNEYIEVMEEHSVLYTIKLFNSIEEAKQFRTNNYLKDINPDQLFWIHNDLNNCGICLWEE